MDAMTAPPHEYVLARAVLLDALYALGPHLHAVVLVGAQAVYPYTGDADLAIAPTTTDADLVLSPVQLLDEKRDRAADGVRVGEVPHAPGGEAREQAHRISSIAPQRLESR